MTLEGRVDRVDKKKIEGTDFFSIVDYKTGGYKKLSRDSDVVGEDVQLISYCSLIGDRAIKASYLVLDKSLMEITVSGDLEQAMKRNIKRLKEIFLALEDGATLKAQGISSSCKYCESKGLCRKTYWENW